MHEFQYDYIKQSITKIRDYYSRILTTWCMKLKLKMFMTILVRIKKIFDFTNNFAVSKYYDDSKALADYKMTDNMRVIAIDEFVVLKPKMLWVLERCFKEY